MRAECRQRPWWLWQPARVGRQLSLDSKQRILARSGLMRHCRRCLVCPKPVSCVPYLAADKRLRRAVKGAEIANVKSDCVNAKSFQSSSSETVISVVRYMSPSGNRIWSTGHAETDDGEVS